MSFQSAVAKNGLKVKDVLIAQSSGDKIYLQTREDKKECFIKVK